MIYKNTEQYLELTEKYGGIIVMIPIMPTMNG